VVALNRAVAVAEAHGPAEALALVDGLERTAHLEEYHVYHAIRADLLRRLGRTADAVAAYRAAIEHRRTPPSGLPDPTRRRATPADRARRWSRMTGLTVPNCARRR